MIHVPDIKFIETSVLALEAELWRAPDVVRDAEEITAVGVVVFEVVVMPNCANPFSVALLGIIIVNHLEVVRAIEPSNNIGNPSIFAVINTINLAGRGWTLSNAIRCLRRSNNPDAIFIKVPSVVRRISGPAFDTQVLTCRGLLNPEVINPLSVLVEVASVPAVELIEVACLGWAHIALFKRVPLAG